MQVIIKIYIFIILLPKIPTQARPIPNNKVIADDSIEPNIKYR